MTETHPAEKPFSGGPASSPQRFPVTLLLIFVALTAGIISAGYTYYLNYEKHYRAEFEHQLTAIADLKTDELVQWRQERMGDGAVFYRNDNFTGLVRRYWETPEDEDARGRLQRWLEQIRSAHQYDQVLLLDAQGVIRSSFPVTSEPVAHHLVGQAPEIMRAGRVTFLDFHRDEPDGPIHLAVVVPILDDQDGGRPLGLLVLRIDPETYLFPFIQRWPTPSRTAETLLVRREGSDVVYLNDLRFRKNVALNLRLPLENKELPATAAALGRKGIMEGVDYRGESVLADVCAIPDSPWFLVAKLDLAEVEGRLTERLWEVIVLVGVMLLATAAGLGFIWRRQSARFYQERLEAAEALRASEELYHRTLDGMAEGFQIVGRDWRYLYVNDAAARHARRAKEELLGQTMMQAYPGIEGTPMFAALRRCMEQRTPDRIENEFAYPDGSKAWFELGIQPAAEGVSIISLDITERKRAEEALRESEQKFRATFDLAAAGITHVAPDGKWIEVNHRMCEIMGYSREELLRKSFPELTHPEDLDTDLELHQRLLAGEVPAYSLEKRYRRRDGSMVWANLTVSLVRAPSGAPSYFISVVEDITEKKRAEAEQAATQRHYRELFDNVAIALLRTTPGPEGGFIDANPAMVEMLEADNREQLMALHPSEIYYDPSQRRIVTDAIIAKGFIKGEEVRFKTLKGRPIWCRITAVKKTDANGQVYFDNSMEDITDKKLMEAQLKKTLEDLERSNRELEQFAYVASHDLQEPLRMVGSFVQLLQKRYQGKLDSDADEFIQYAVDGANRMKTMIQDLLTFSRVGTRGKPPENLDVNVVLGEALANLRTAIEESHAVITNEALPEIRGDESQMVMLLQNLIGNAIKFRGDGPPRVHVSAHREDDQWVFAVRDTGIGIEPQFADRIFVIFQRLHGREEYQGTGIGLAICKKIVERHGGKIWVESKFGEGSTFYFSLPRSA
jgi:PAS domain S-box-containing protein